MYEPYLDTDWAAANPEVSYILYLTNEELKQQKAKKNGRLAQRNIGRNEGNQKAA
jgi:hypothetical protein